MFLKLLFILVAIRSIGSFSTQIMMLARSDDSTGMVTAIIGQCLEIVFLVIVAGMIF